MQAIILEKYGHPDELKLKEVDIPVPKGDEVLVKVHASAINDYDWCFSRGKPYVYRIMFGITKPKTKTPGMELSGVVESIGDKVERFKVGDEIYGDISEHGFGAFAEYACVNEAALALKPKNMSFTDAASIPHASLLALQGLVNIGKIQEGQKILINGAGGGMGFFALNIAKSYGAEVTGVDTGNKLQVMLSNGFDRVVDYKVSDFTKSRQRYDLILDAKTNRSPFAYNRALADGGNYVTVGGDLNRLLQMVLFKAIFYKRYRKTIDVVSLKANQGLDVIEQLYKDEKIKPIIDGPYNLRDVPRLIQYFGEGRHVGKIVISHTG